MKAVILCAGMGTRMYPFTKDIHKSMIKIKGKAIIEHTIEYLKSKDIHDITIVVGYKAEQFEYLKEKYNIETRVSTLYETHNNYTSMQLVLDKLEDCLVLEGDLYIIDDFIPKIDKTKDQYFSQKITHGLELGFEIRESDNRILSVTNDSTTGWALIGIFYMTKKLASIVGNEFKKCSQNDYWDDALWRIMDEHSLYANKCETPVIEELDKIEDIIYYSIMTHDEIIEQCSQDGKFEKIDSNTYIVNDKKYIFENNKIIVE